MTSLSAEFPKISIIMPVFNHTRYLEEAVLSAINQTYPNTEAVIYDDCSTDPGVRRVLMKFRGDPRVKIFWGKTNEGISMATNRAIIQSTGEYLAFMDCDDVLPPHALETASHYIRSNPQAQYFYSNREEIDENGRVIRRIELSKYGLKPPPEQILTFMFATHLKIIKREAFHEAGLLKKEFDSCQDYDLALRMSRYFTFFHIPEYLYRYRIHDRQISRVKKREQARLAYRARDVEVARRKIYNGEIGRKRISVIMLTMNRWQKTKMALDHLVNSTRLPYELIILDNNSSDETAGMLRWYAKQHPHVRLILEKENLGCAGGRQKALSEARGDYIVMLDNDIRVTPWWLENLLIRLVESRADAACCRVVLPDGRVQYNGGSFRVRDRFILFSFLDSSLDQNDLNTLIERECDWIPGGATIYRRAVFEKAGFCPDLRGGLEDNDLSLQMGRAGLKMVNCPAAKVVHHHRNFDPKNMQDREYSRARHDKKILLETMITFYRRNGLIVYDPWVFQHLDIPRGSGEETVNYFARLDGCGDNTGAADGPAGEENCETPAVAAPGEDHGGDHQKQEEKNNEARETPGRRYSKPQNSKLRLTCR